MAKALPPAPATTGLFTYVESLGIDVNSLLDAAAYAESRPRSAIESCRRARHALEVLEETSVRQLRRNGSTWADVAQQFGISTQAAHKRFRHLD